MAQWIEDPQGRQEIEKVTKELKLPVWKASYKGKFREFWNEVWSKIEDNFLNLKNIVETKEPTITKKTGFNLDKTDDYNQDDTNKLGTAKALKKLYDELSRKINALNFCPYNIGDIYVTIKTEDPSTIWQGTKWQKIENRFLKGTSSNEETAMLGGSNTKSLTVANLPSHSHDITINEDGNHTHTQAEHSHGRGTQNITGQFDGLNNQSSSQQYGAFYKTHNPESYGAGSGGGDSPLGFDASKSWVGTSTSAAPAIYSAGNHKHTAKISNTGNGTAFDIEPAYYTVNMWLRIE